ncbi:MAG: hypothetical protein Q9M13_05195 [Mariprofundales bacterium]|nr:hypothetical protein [Mariprofundales bacterium]
MTASQKVVIAGLTRNPVWLKILNIKVFEETEPTLAQERRSLLLQHSL